MGDRQQAGEEWTPATVPEPHPTRVSVSPSPCLDVPHSHQPAVYRQSRMRRPQLPQPCYHWLATLTLLSLLPLAQENISRKIYFCINVNKVSVLSVRLQCGPVCCSVC